LYKYLVTVGILLTVLTVYYPLKEKQQLEILKIKLENDLEVLNFKILENKKEVEAFKVIKKDAKISVELKENVFSKIKIYDRENRINQIVSENKYNELNSRTVYIIIYNFLFWIFFPIGIALITFGFLKWNLIKKIDDRILELEKNKLEIEVSKLERESEVL
jgi:hypothetical protein